MLCLEGGGGGGMQCWLLPLHMPVFANEAASHRRTPSMPPQIVAKAADAFSAGDLVNRRVRQTQNWALSPFAVVMGTIFPATYMRGGREVLGLYPMEPNFPR